ncbi:MAG: lytic transglycosylase domain-containing protein [Acidobacteriota bacterium]
MVRKNIKRFSIMLISLFFMGLTGLFIGLNDINHYYVDSRGKIVSLNKELTELKSEAKLKDFKIKNYDFMKYKINAFSSRYPVYSNIIDSTYTKSQKYDFKPELVLSIIKVESNFNPKAISYKGAYGLMQVNLSVWEDELNINKDKIFDIDYNIDLGLQVLKIYYDESKGNLKRAIHLYNNGYKYNNYAYVDKVDSTLLSFTPYRLGNKKIILSN